MDALNVVVLVSSDTSDIYFANQLALKVNVVGIVVEQQYERANLLTRIGKALRMLADPGRLMQKITSESAMHRYGRRATEVVEKQFGEDGKRLSAPPGCKVIHTLGSKALNDPVYVDEIAKLAPDVIAVCGTSILREGILSIPPKGVLNLHGGLAQKYRGVWTTYWAVLNNEPEYIGATVHYVSKGIDDGEIIFQGRPDICKEDNPEMLYTKVVKLGIKMMVAAIGNIESGEVKSYPPERLGDLYLDRMMTPDVVKNVWKHYEQGVIRRYLENKTDRDKNVIRMIRDTSFKLS